MNANRRLAEALVMALSLMALFGRPCLAFDDAVPCSVSSVKRLALVIGNQYAGNDQISGIEDASAMAEALCDMGFSVFTLYNGKKDAMTGALTDFQQRITNAEVVVFYFSGHGYQIDNVNYLLPFGSTIDPADPEIPIGTVLEALAGAPRAVKLLFLDACRSSEGLPVTSGGQLKDIPKWQKGLEEPGSGVPSQTVFSYAADYGKEAISGAGEELSPYTSALLRSIREPGLTLLHLLKRVHDEVYASTKRKQSPAEKGLPNIPKDFYLRPPVTVKIAIDKADDDLFVLLNGKIVKSRNRDETNGAAIDGRVALNAGENDMVLMVYNQRSFLSGQLWTQPEGWSYKMKILREDGTEIPCLEQGQEVPCPPFEDGEEVPFKDGAHHGKLFEVARAVLEVNKTTAELKITKLDTKVWNNEAPFESRDQGVLDERNLRELVRELLTLVRGNRSLGPKVKECMNQSARRDDLLKSALAFLGGSSRPFDDFDKGLIACVGAPVATSFEDR